MSVRSVYFYTHRASKLALTYGSTKGSNLPSSFPVSIHSASPYDVARGERYGERHCQIRYSCAVVQVINYIVNGIQACWLKRKLGCVPQTPEELLCDGILSYVSKVFLVKAGSVWQHCNLGNSGASARLPYLFFHLQGVTCVRSASLSSCNMRNIITFACSRPRSSCLWDRVCMGGQQDWKVSFWKKCLSPNWLTEFPT